MTLWGRTSRITVPYTGSAGRTNSTAAAILATYDPLSRQLKVTDNSGGITNYTHNQNDTLIEIAPAPSGENTKKRPLEINPMG